VVVKMLAAGIHYPPLALPFFLALVFLFAIVVVLLELRVLTYAYERMGIKPRYFFGLLLLSLLGSHINVPVARLPSERVLTEREVSFFGVRYIVPTVEESPETIVAVNVGGAVVPVLLSLYLLIKRRLYTSALVGTAIVSAVVHMVARPVPGVGIAIPTFLPPVVAALVAVALTRLMPAVNDAEQTMTVGWSRSRMRLNAAPLAYIIGSMGTLIGADLLNLGHLGGLGAPVASIGGAGTFDGIFLTGILAVLLA
jgi:uncharacterized membrane protein